MWYNALQTFNNSIQLVMRRGKSKMLWCRNSLLATVGKESTKAAVQREGAWTAWHERLLRKKCNKNATPSVHRPITRNSRAFAEATESGTVDPGATRIKIAVLAWFHPRTPENTLRAILSEFSQGCEAAPVASKDSSLAVIFSCHHSAQRNCPWGWLR